MSELKNLLVVRSGPIAGTSYVIEKNESYLGRDLANDLPVPDPEISRRHARFLRKEDGVYLEDLGSTNGTFVNGVRLTAPQLLHIGDVITLAENTVMSYGVKEESTQPTPVTPVTPVAPRTYEPGLYEPEPAFQESAAYTPVPQPIPQQPLPTVPEPVYREKKKTGWCLIVLIILLIIAVIVGLVLLFMPASWWCTITFNQLPGCPIY